MLVSSFFSIKEISPLRMHGDKISEVFPIWVQRQEQTGWGGCVWTDQTTAIKNENPLPTQYAKWGAHTSSHLISFTFLSNHNKVPPPGRISIPNTKNISFVNNVKKILNAGKCWCCVAGCEGDIFRCNIAICTVRMYFFLFYWLVLSTNTIWHPFQVPLDFVLNLQRTYFL